MGREEKMEEKGKSLSDVISRKVVQEVLESQRKGKKSKKRQFLKLRLTKDQIKKNFVSYILLRDNGSMDIRKMRIQDGAIYIPENKTYHMAQGNHIWTYKGNLPVIVQPEWSTEPVTKESLTRQSIKEGTNVMGQKFLIKKAEEVAAGLKVKSPVDKKWVLYIIGGIALIYLISMAFGNPIF